MDRTPDLLIEIGTEELPPGSLRQLSTAFAQGFEDQLTKHSLAYSGIEPFATPRRLALLVRDLATRQPDQEVVRKGPTLKAAFDDRGEPTKAALGFARSVGVGLEDLQQEETSKGAWLVFRQIRQGESTRDLIVDMTAKALDRLPIPKRMRWGDRGEEFVRPVHWIAMVFGDQPISGKLLGVAIGSSTRGHRFHAPLPITIGSATHYADLLRTQGRVEPSFEVRRQAISDQVEALAAEAGGRAIMVDTLLDEVTALCEWPCAIMGSFDEDFLEVPSEVLIETMQKHQKYFALTSASGRLLPRFITISNIESRDPAQVRAGNERVIRPRFTDAAFFWRQDSKQPLDALVPKLSSVVFQEQLGTLAEKSARLVQIARHIAGLLGMDEEEAARAAQLSKCDLLTLMIGEFPSLQGTMGRYYAQMAGETSCVALAMEEQYMPRYAGDVLPQSDCGKVLSIADKIDTLVGIFAIGQRPTGVKDPYALRRAAIGVLRILIETPLPLDLKEILLFAANELRDKVAAAEAAEDVFGYSMERLAGYYQDRGIEARLVDSVLAVDPHVPSDIDRRISAVKEFELLPEAEALTAANKRIRNILRKSTETDLDRIHAALLQEPAEQKLHARVIELQSGVAPLLEAQDYRGVLRRLSGLREDVDAFFDQVMVMDEDADLRRNRLSLLRALQTLFLQIADISLLSLQP